MQTNFVFMVGAVVVNWLLEALPGLKRKHTVLRWQTKEVMKNLDSPCFTQPGVYWAGDFGDPSDPHDFDFLYRTSSLYKTSPLIKCYPIHWFSLGTGISASTKCTRTKWWRPSSIALHLDLGFSSSRLCQTKATFLVGNRENCRLSMTF